MEKESIVKNLFNESGKLSSDTGAQVTVICAGKAGDVSAFDSPSVEDILRRYYAESNAGLERQKTDIERLCRGYVSMKRTEEGLKEGVGSLEKELQELHWSLEFLEMLKETVEKIQVKKQ